MKKLLLLLLYVAAGLGAQEGQIEMESQTCDFDGKKITLSGSISLEHELGKMTSEEAVLFANPDDKKFSIGLLKINNNVVITSKEGSRLTCDEALINYKAMQGSFYSSNPAAFVIFQEGTKEKAQPELTLKSRSMQAQISRQHNSDKSSSSNLKEITALNDVIIEYNDFTVTADKGVYTRSDSPDQQRKEVLAFHSIPGTMILSMEKPDSFCLIKSTKGDFIQSLNMHIDTANSEINFSMPQGKVQIQQNPVESNLEFSADTLIWKLNGPLHHSKKENKTLGSNSLNEPNNPAGGIFRLIKNVSVDIHGKGALTTENELEIHYQNLNGKRQLNKIESNGYTTLTSPEKLEGLYHYLYNHGKMLVDHDKMITTFDSPIDNQGKVLPEKQVVFIDSVGELHADKLTLYYQDVEGKISPARLIAEGNVYLLDRKGAPADREVAMIHFALADRVKFEFETREALFTGAKKNRVLFYDKTNNLQISAPALKLKRDGGNNKESIQGMGDVRFSFMETEAQQLKSRFESLPHRY